MVLVVERGDVEQRVGTALAVRPRVVVALIGVLRVSGLDRVE